VLYQISIENMIIIFISIVVLICSLVVFVLALKKEDSVKKQLKIVFTENEELKMTLDEIRSKKAVPNTPASVISVGNHSGKENDQIHERRQLEELSNQIKLEKESLEAQKIKYDEKIKKLWEQSTAIHKEKERISELHENLAREKQKVETLLKEIQVKNKEITDNINYAQRIQSALLPDLRQFANALPQSFVLYLPKDIVSGDFYGFVEKEGKLIIIAGDCTGHGVSGAFMSMIGLSLLNQIIKEKGIICPGEILNMLNISIIDALNQSETESNDGMDLSICTIDLMRNELQFAGANRPLWLIRNNEINICPPDKYPIGGLQLAKNRAFTNQTIPLQKGDTFYIFTDGFADQFGGEKNKKMMTTRFKELLLSVQGLTLKDQGAYTRNFFERWKGQNEQVDDVLVIGVRI